MPPAPQLVFPLHWESTGDQWWYASPIDWAAANGHYDVVRELLHLDPNLIMKLTSLRRIRRLETVWDEYHSQFQGAAVCRAHIAKNLLTESENKGKKSLMGAGYGGWLLYTAAAAGDTGFIRELLEREPLLVFGEGEYGVSDILYAAARSKNSEVFRWLLNLSLNLKVGGGGGGGGEGDINNGSSSSSSRSSVFRWEMMNRAAHAAARGGNREMMREIILLAAAATTEEEEEHCCGSKDVLLLLMAFRDAQGSTLLHSASGRGQIEVVNDLVSSYGNIIVTATDNHGNRALNVAAYRGHLAVVQALLITSSQSELYHHHQNNYGDTFLHMAVAGFTSPGFRRLDHQMNLMKHLITWRSSSRRKSESSSDDLGDLINVRNNEGRTALHCALALNNNNNNNNNNIPLCQVIHLLMSVPCINLNIRDADILFYASASPQPAPLFSPGQFVSNNSCHASPSFINPSKSSSLNNNNNNTATRLKILLRWPKKKNYKSDLSYHDDDDESILSSPPPPKLESSPTPLRQRFAKQSSSLPNNKRVGWL